MRKQAYGIDFGTTNSAISFMDNDTTRIIRTGNNRRKMIRSELFFPRDDDAIHIGDNAFAEYLASEKDGRFIQSIKTVLPSKLFKTTRIRNTEYEAEDLIALILEYLKFKADRVTGRDVTKVVLGRPVTFAGDENNEQLAKRRLRTAAEYAGFEEVAFQFEPIAAAMSYERTLASDKLVLIADLGGGTSDFSLIRLGPDRFKARKRSADVLGNSGVGVAGDALDSAVMSSAFREYFGSNVKHRNFTGQWLPIPSGIFNDLCNKGRVIYLYTPGMVEQLRDIIKDADHPEPINRLKTLIENNLGHQVYQTIEGGKKKLSRGENATIQFSKEGLELYLEMTRTQFNEIINDNIVKVDKSIDRLLRETGVSKSEIDTVYMTGGTSLVPRLQQLLAAKFPESELEVSRDSFLSVVNGLGLSCLEFF